MTFSKNKYLVLFSLFLLYLSWGSSYIITKLALEHAPGIMLTFIRMFISGSTLLLITRLRGEKFKLTRTDFRNYLILSLLLVVVGGAFVSKGQETVSSGTTAMLLGIVPTWMVLSDWIFSKIRPSFLQIIGLSIGFISISWMQYFQGIKGETSLIGFSLIFASTIGWVYGSYLTKILKFDTEMSFLRSSGFMMLFGGIESLIFAFLCGERISDVHLTSTAIFPLFLLVSTTLIGYAVYLWLIQNTRPMIAISYEFVNPVVALFLGWLIGGELVELPLIVACFFLVSSAFLAVSNKNAH